MKVLFLSLLLSLSFNVLADDQCIQKQGNVSVFLDESTKVAFDLGTCISNCSSQQGICIANCQGNGQCIGQCAVAQSQCVANCSSYQ